MSLQRVYWAVSEQEADLVKNLLIEGGMHAETSTDDAGGMLPSLDLSKGVFVVVHDHNVKEALELVAEYQKGHAALHMRDDE